VLVAWSKVAEMDFNKHKSDWQSVGARRRTDGLQQADELESFKESY
jgi:hypothetical protein